MQPYMQCRNWKSKGYRRVCGRSSFRKYMGASKSHIVARIKKTAKTSLRLRQRAELNVELAACAEFRSAHEYLRDCDYELTPFWEDVDDEMPEGWFISANGVAMQRDLDLDVIDEEFMRWYLNPQNWLD